MFITADVSSILSAEMFNDFLLEPMKHMIRDLDYCIIHMHSTYLHTLESLLPLPKLRAVQVSVDPNGPSVNELIQKFRNILDRKGLIIGGQISLEDINTLVSELPSEGLCIFGSDPGLYRSFI